MSWPLICAEISSPNTPFTIHCPLLPILNLDHPQNHYHLHILFTFLAFSLCSFLGIWTQSRGRHMLCSDILTQTSDIFLFLWINIDSIIMPYLCSNQNSLENIIWHFFLMMVFESIPPVEISNKYNLYL